MKILTQFDGWALIALFFVVMSAIVLCLRKRTQTKAEFLAAGHSAPWLLTAFSMAATWVWAPSMFTAAEKAYTQGFAGMFWFIVPNVLTMVLFAFFANKMRKLRPDGWTFSDYIRETYSTSARLRVRYASCMVLQTSRNSESLLRTTKFSPCRMLTTPRLRKSSGRLENSTSSALALTISMPS